MSLSIFVSIYYSNITDYYIDNILTTTCLQSFDKKDYIYNIYILYIYIYLTNMFSF